MQRYMLLLILLYLSACANNPLSSYSTNIGTPLTAVSNGELALAESAIPEANNILYYLEHGTVLRLSDSYLASNKDFTVAQGYIDAWITSYHNGTIGLAADTMATSLVNDKVIDYVAKDYEKVMIPTYKALNYFALGNTDSARIEITRMYNLEDIIQNYRDREYAKEIEDKDSNASITKKFPSLQQVETKNQNQYDFKAINTPMVLALKNSYQNAFSHYLAGFVFEALGEPSLARPGYIKSGQLNPDNELIKQSIVDIDKNQKIDDNTTDLLLVEEIGHAPLLKSVSFSVPFVTQNGQNTCSNSINISFPEQVIDNNKTIVNLTVDDKPLYPILFTDFNLMAARYLHDNLPNVFLRNTIRAAKDVALQQSACSGGGNIASLIASVGSAVLSSADERTWAMLPGQIYVSRIKLKRGLHTINIGNGNNFKALRINLTNQYEILSWRVIGSGIYFSPGQKMIN